MPNLYMKVGLKAYLGANAWRAPNAGTVSVGVNAKPLSNGEAGEFTSMEMRGEHKRLHAGRQHNLLVYSLLDIVDNRFAIVWPDVQAVRDKHPSACRLVNIRTGAESDLYDTQDHAAEAARLIIAGKIKASSRY